MLDFFISILFSLFAIKTGTSDGNVANDILIVMHYTPNVQLHSYYASEINKNYATRNGYEFLLDNFFPPELLEKQDARWNKVRIMGRLIEEGLQRTTNTQTKYLVWLDSDLIIANHSFSFDPIIQKYPAVDIIISREVNPNNGIANSGCMIVKISYWSAIFFQYWWNSFDRLSAMDQHVFDLLYYGKLNTAHLESSKHIMLLNATAINSYFPGLVHHQSDNPILHLAGESNFIREHIFELCWKNVDQYQQLQQSSINMTVDEVNSDTAFVVLDLPPFGVSRQFLDNLDYISLHQKQWKRLLNEFHTSTLVSISSTVNFQLFTKNEKLEYFSFLHEIRYKVRETQQSLSKFICYYRSLNATNGVELNATKIFDEKQIHQNSNCIQLKEMFYDDTIRLLYEIYQAYYRYFEYQQLRCSSDPIVVTNKDISEELQSTVDAAFELLIVLHPEDKRYLLVLQELETMMTRLEEIVANDIPDQLKIVYYYQYKLYEFRALHAEVSITFHSDGMAVIHDSNSSLQTSDVNRNNSHLYCQEAILWNEKALELWTKNVHNYQYFGSGNGLLNRYHEALRLMLKLTYLQCSLCQDPSHNVQSKMTGKKYLNDAMSIITQFEQIDQYLEDIIALEKECFMHHRHFEKTNDEVFTKRKKFKRKKNRNSNEGDKRI
jgi:hypothetical protein